MEQDKLDTSLNDSVKQVMQTLPPTIRDYLESGKCSIVAKQIMSKYNLHIDQGGILEREIMLLLMGIDSPEEFVHTLAEEAKLDQQTVNDITKDINEQIFVPLREAMRKKTTDAVKLLDDHKQSHIEISPAPFVPAAPPIPLIKKTSPLIKEYSTDPYRESIDDMK